LPTVDVKVRNLESGQSRVLKRPSWPRLKSVEQRVYENFFSRICDPITETFYPERDMTGNVIEPSDGGSRARYIIHNFVRVKSYTGQEFLTTSGVLVGFSSLGSPIYHLLYKPEIYTKTYWHKERDYNKKTGRMEEKILSPARQQEIYLVPFSAEVVEELFKHVIKSDTPAVYNRGNKLTVDKPCNFCCSR
jgi:hypothetical protein